MKNDRVNTEHAEHATILWTTYLRIANQAF